MLIALYTNLNIFSGLMAQGDDTYGDSYSKYPTKDKKVVCQTGRFEGFLLNQSNSVNCQLHKAPQDRTLHR